tara:strand:+ start:1 stop:1029 length:1029 start_codon:yes stop_codon:yes gene_type:complete
MSGTSMDGLDISCSQYYKKKNIWNFKLIASETIPYNQKIKLDLLKTFNQDYNIIEMDTQFGLVLSDFVSQFLKKYNLSVDLISSHGHTIFHNPQKGYTKQIGLGSVIAKKTGIPVVCNFRQQDIDFGGQGAPLVPIGDKLLFGEYDSCLNLGGITNISFDWNSDRLAFDISPCNIILNYLANKTGEEFDKFGHIAQNGIVNTTLLEQLNTLSYYDLRMPKSLGKEYIDAFFIPIIDKSNIKIQDLLCTFVEHIAIQIGYVFDMYQITNCLVTGGGAFNHYLISRISQVSNIEIVIPTSNVVNFKEAIIFGFLGVLRLLNQNNCLSSATGASKDHCSGDIYVV